MAGDEDRLQELEQAMAGSHERRVEANGETPPGFANDDPDVPEQYRTPPAGAAA